MNRTIALLIPAILLMAMALIVFQQFHSSSSEEELNLQSVNPERAANGSAGAPSPLSGTGTPVQPPLPGLQAQPEKPVQEPALKPETSAQQQTLQEPEKSVKNQPEQQQAASAAAGASSVTQPPAEPPAPKAPPKTEEKPAPKEEKKPEQKPEQKPEAKPEKAAAEQAAAGQAHKMHSIKFEYQGSDMLLVMSADTEFEYKSFQLASPERLVVDVIGAWSGMSLPNVPSNRLIKGVRGGKTDRGYRIVLDLKETPKGYETKRDANKVTVRVY